MPPGLVIEAWPPEHPRWDELLDCIRALGQENWVNFSAEWHRSSHLLAACLDGRVVGFLRFVVQPIGAEEEHQPLEWGGEPLLEAKILAFGVVPAMRRRGIGWGLQEAALEEARRLGCYQVRSHSAGKNSENHRLKLAMGFAVQPVIRGEDRQGVYFILPLGAPGRRKADG